MSQSGYHHRSMTTSSAGVASLPSEPQKTSRWRENLCCERSCDSDPDIFDMYPTEENRTSAGASVLSRPLSSQPMQSNRHSTFKDRPLFGSESRESSIDLRRPPPLTVGQPFPAAQTAVGSQGTPSTLPGIPHTSAKYRQHPLAQGGPAQLPLPQRQVQGGAVHPADPRTRPNASQTPNAMHSQAVPRLTKVLPQPQQATGPASHPSANATHSASNTYANTSQPRSQALNSIPDMSQAPPASSHPASLNRERKTSLSSTDRNAQVAPSPAPSKMGVHKPSHQANTAIKRVQSVTSPSNTAAQHPLSQVGHAQPQALPVSQVPKSMQSTSSNPNTEVVQTRDPRHSGGQHATAQQLQARPPLSSHVLPSTQNGVAHGSTTYQTGNTFNGPLGPTVANLASLGPGNSTKAATLANSTGASRTQPRHADDVTVTVKGGQMEHKRHPEPHGQLQQTKSCGGAAAAPLANTSILRGPKHDLPQDVKPTHSTEGTGVEQHQQPGPPAVRHLLQGRDSVSRNKASIVPKVQMESQPSTYFSSNVGLQASNTSHRRSVQAPGDLPHQTESKRQRPESHPSAASAGSRSGQSDVKANQITSNGVKSGVLPLQRANTIAQPSAQPPTHPPQVGQTRAAAFQATQLNGVSSLATPLPDPLLTTHHTAAVAASGNTANRC